MENFAFIVFLFLLMALGLSVFRKNNRFWKPRLFRWLIVLGAIAFYTVWFVNKSSDNFVKDAISLQIINKLPQPVDFYILIVNRENAEKQFEMQHSGKIRTDHYRIEYLRMQNSNEYWIAGFIGRKNLVYFSQHALLNKNMDQIVEAKNYIIQSQKLSEMASKEVEIKQDENRSISVWVTLGLLLTFLNGVLLFRKK